MLVITTMSKTKSKIINAALKLFSQKGYLATTTKDIAREADIAEVTLFRYFPTKQKLFKEVLESQSFLPTLKDLLPKIENINYKFALKTVARYYLKLLKKKRDLICIMHTEIFQYPEEIRAIQSKIISDVSLIFANYLEIMKKRGILRDIDTNYASMAYFGMLFNLFIKKELFKRKINLNRALNTYIEIFYEGTRRDS